MILSIETATPICSVAFHNDGQLLAQAELRMDKSHSGSLVLLIQQLMSHLSVKASDLSAVAVSQGPGSYTGLRIGLSTAKGICFAHDVPLIAVDTLQAMALSISSKHKISESQYYMPMLDARRMEAYAALYNYKNQVELAVQPIILTNSNYEAFLNPKYEIFYFGDGAEKAKDIFSDYPNMQFIDDVFPSAQYIGYLAYQKYLQKSFENLAYFEPFYLKEFYSPLPKKKNLF